MTVADIKVVRKTEVVFRGNVYCNQLLSAVCG